MVPPCDDAALRDEIALSWRRSRLCGLAPESGIADTGFAEAAARTGSLFRAARPVLDELVHAAEGTGVTLLLGDEDGRIVDRRTGGGEAARVLDRRGVVPGMRYSEETAGTNGVGTALELGRSVAVHGEEHFLEGLKGFSCYGRPIRHPVTRRVVGVLDITGVGRSANPLFRPLAVRAVDDIEQALLAASPRSHLRLMAAFRQVGRRPGAVVGIDGDVTLSNPAAQDLLEPLDHAMLRGLCTAFTEPEHAGPTDTSAELASGLRVRVRAYPVPGSRRGRVFRVEAAGPDVETARAVTGGDAVPAGRAGGTGGGRSGRTRGVPGDGQAADAGHGPVLVLGEPGSGVTTAARAVAADHGCTEVVTVEAAVFDEYGGHVWVRRVREALRGDSDGLRAGPGGLRGAIIERADRLPADRIRQLARMLAGPETSAAGPETSVAGPAKVVPILTASAGAAGDGEPTAFSEVLAQGRSRIDVPPLRRRRGEFAAIVQRMLDDLSPSTCPADRLRPTAELVEMLAAHSWPGNLAELRTVLTAAADTATAGTAGTAAAETAAGTAVGDTAAAEARGGGGPVRPEDLPPGYRLGAKAVRLTGMDRAERDAVVAALAAAGGNKRRAAQELGISRTTLYSRIRTLDITPMDV